MSGLLRSQLHPTALATPSRAALRFGSTGGGLLAVMAVACATPLPARAEFDSEKYLTYSVGPVTLRPQLEVAEIYDSNLFYRETDEIDDFFTSVRPGLLAVYGNQAANYFSLRYTLDSSFYMERDDLNNTGHLFTHQSRFQFSRLAIQATDTFSLTRTLLGGGFGYVQGLVGLMALNDNWKVDYEISPKALVGVKALVDFADYDASDLGQYHLYDYFQYGGGARFGYRPSDKILIFPEVTATQTQLASNRSTIPDAPDLTTLGFSFGAEGDFTPKLTGLISAGYELREYADGSDIPDGWIAESQLRWQARPKTVLTLGYRHWIQASRELVDWAYSADRVSLSVGQELGTQGRWSVSASGYYQFDSYDNEVLIGGVPVLRENEIAGFSLRGNYRWQPWLTLTGGYDFTTYGDNISSIPDYDVHRVSIRAVAGY